MKRFIEQKIITSGFGLALLTLLGSAAQASNTGAISVLCSSLSLVFFVLVYYLLNRQISELKLAEASFQDLYNNAPCGYHSLDKDANFIAINDTELSWLGYSRDEVIGKLKFWDLLTPESKATFEKNLPRFLESGWLKDLEFQMIRKDGTILPVLLSATAIKDSAGKLVASRSTIFDITERKQALEALRQSEERLRLALEAANMGTWDCNILTNHITWSSNHEQLFGLAPGTFGGTYKAFEAFVHPDDRESVIQAVNRARLQQQDYHQECRIVWPDGSIHWVEDKGKFFYNAEGRAVRMVGTVMDISDRKRREEQLRLLESVVVNTNDAVLITSAEPISEPGPRIVYANPAFTRMTSFNPEEVIGQTLHILQGAKADGAAREQIRAALETGQPVRVDSINYRKDGSEFWVDLSIVPVANEKGRFTHSIAVLRDITERKQAEVALRESEERFRRAILDAPLPIIIHGENGEVLQINYAWTELSGYTHQEIPTLKDWIEKAYGITKEVVRADIDRLYSLDRCIPEGESIVTTSDGSTRIWEFYSAPLGKLPDGRRQAISMALDITKRKQAEAALQKAKDQLEIRVAERTAQLKQANIRLQRELFERSQVEQALRQSEERWQLAIRGSKDGIWDLKVKTNEVFYSARWKQMLGYEDREIGNHIDEWFKRVHPDDLERVMQSYEDHLSRKTPFYTNEHRLLCKNGTYKWILTRGQALWDEDGNPVRVTGSQTDISDRKQAEEALRESQEQLQAILDNSPTVIYLTDTQNRYILINRRYETLFKITREQILDRNIYEIWPHEIADALCMNNRRVLVGGTPIEIEEVVPHDDGLHTYITIKFPLKDAQGVTYAVCGISKDITERKRAEEALRESEERFRSAFDYAAIGMALVAPDGRWLKVNHSLCEIVGYLEQELLATSVHAITHPDDLDADLNYMHQMLLGEIRYYQMEKRYFHKLGHVVWILLSVSLVRDAHSKPLYFIDQIQDITARKQALSALRESEGRLQAILDNACAVIYLKDTLGRYILINRQYETLFKVNKEEVLGKSDYDFFPKEIADAFRDNDYKVIAAGKPLDFEEIAPHDDGIHTYLSIKFPLRDDAGVPYGVCGFSTDITERKLSEEALRWSEEKFRQLAEHIQDVFWIFDLATQKYLYFNPSFERVFGRTCESMYTDSYSFLEAVHPEDRQRVRALCARRMQETDAGNMEFRIVQPSGEIRWIHDRYFPICNQSGQIYRFVGIAEDITERKQQEAALRQAYDELEIRVQQRTRELFKANEELKIENAERKRVEAELKTLARQQAAVAELGQQALAGNQLDSLMNLAVALIAQILEVEYCKVLELLPEGKAVRLQAGVGWQEELLGNATVSMATDIQAGYTLVSSEPIVVEDFQKEVRFAGPTLLHENGVVSGMSVIIPGQNCPYGVLEAHTTRQRSFTKDDVNFLQATANVLATAINRQQVEEALRRAHNELEIRVQERTTDLAKANLELQQEIIERFQAEEELQKLIAILEATPDIVITASVDEQVRYLNSAARKIFGLGEYEDFTNFTIPDTCPDWAYNIVRNEGIPRAMHDGVWVGETAFLSYDKREILVSQVLIAHKSPDGSVKLLSTIARDITQQKQIAATLLEAERRWRSLLENVRLVVVGLDYTGKVEYVNPFFLELVGYTQAEVQGKDWFATFLPPHQRQRVQNNFLEIRSTEFHTYDQNTILTKSGEERVVAWNHTLLQNLQGDVIGTLSIGEDITERYAIERMKDEFISVVSHELRTPLTSIHGALNLLSSGLVDAQSDRGRRVIEIAAESAERLVRLVNDILDLERLESGKISLVKQLCNAADLIIKATDLMQVMANRAGITLSVSSPAIQLNADPDRIIQVLTNLLGNAIKFSPRGSTVWLTVELQRVGETGRISPSHPISPTVLFKVLDQGRGIPADKLESIFERFHQVDASDSRKKGGTGLGLAICRSIVQQHGGRIWVESTLGEGSSFYFTLPGQTAENDNHDNQANLGD